VKNTKNRALSQGLALVLVLTGLGTLYGGPANAVVPAADTPTPDHGYPSIDYAGVINPPTADKPQSKLWWNDGSWWADMWTTGSGWHIYKLDRETETWVDTGVLTDSRASTLADTLWDGTHLYIASHVVSTSTESNPAASLADKPARLYRYSYVDGKYTLDKGFPNVITNNSSESLTIDRDSTGTVWATWTEVTGDATAGFTSSVFVNHSATDGEGWATPQVLPADNPHPSPDDISSVVAFNRNQVGIMWTDHLTGSVHWATHTDGKDPSNWKVQDAIRGKGQADDHLNLKSLQADAFGRVYAAVKTSLDVTSSDKTLPQLLLLVFKPGTGAFTKSTIATVADCHTRPQILLDPENNTVHAYMTGPSTSVTDCAFSGVEGSVYEKTAAMDNPVFAPGRGTPVIQDSGSPNINNVTTTKQSITSASGAVILASDNVAKRYWFADLRVDKPDVSTFTDVPADSLFADEIAWMAANGISTGWTEADGSKTYRPLEPVNRDAMAAFMYRLAGEPDFNAPSSSPFTDVPTTSQFYKEITWLADHGITTGWTEPDGSKTYRPLEPVNRDAMAAFMYRFNNEFGAVKTY
jgi:hypothetical protein